jgi:hypothetical protein
MSHVDGVDDGVGYGVSGRSDRGYGVVGGSNSNPSVVGGSTGSQVDHRKEYKEVFMILEGEQTEL